MNRTLPHAFFKLIVPIIAELWKERCVDRTTPVIGGRIVAEDISLSKKITHLYTLREMVLTEDELKIFNEPIYVRSEDTNQQIKKCKSEGASIRQQQTLIETNQPRLRYQGKYQQEHK